MLNGTVTSSQECTLKLPTTNMGDGEEDIFLFGTEQVQELELSSVTSKVSTQLEYLHL